MTVSKNQQLNLNIQVLTKAIDVIAPLVENGAKDNEVATVLSVVLSYNPVVKASFKDSNKSYSFITKDMLKDIKDKHILELNGQGKIVLYKTYSLGVLIQVSSIFSNWNNNYSSLILKALHDMRTILYKQLIDLESSFFI